MTPSSCVEPTDLLGTWVLRRTIEDRLTGEPRQVAGTATLVAESPDRIRWSEEGTMTWRGSTTPVSRTLAVVRRADGWWVTFADGRDFHPWAPSEYVDHPCGADHYRGLISPDIDPDIDPDTDAGGGPVMRWTVRWDVSGPDKDYTMRTEHRRVED